MSHDGSSLIYLVFTFKPTNSLITSIHTNRNWEDYKNGFGHFQTSRDEFWLGNDHILVLLHDGRIMHWHYSV